MKSTKKIIKEEKHYVELPVAWFERLIEITKKVEQKDMPVSFLLGYCSSAKEIVKNFKRNVRLQNKKER